MTTLVARPDAALRERYATDAVVVFDADERIRFLDEAGRPRDPEQLPWELLYRIEPDLYGRLVAGEKLHEGILDWLPTRCGRVLEVGAGTGRLTLDLAARCESVVAVEPSAGLRRILEQRLRDEGISHVRALRGFFDSLPAAAADYDMVISCSAFTTTALADPERCLDMIESRCARDGLVVVVWPSDVGWLRGHGYQHVEFAGPMTVEYASPDEAVRLARIFYPGAVEEIARRGSRFVDFTTLGMRAPRDLCWKQRR